MKIICTNLPYTLNYGYVYTHKRIFSRLREFEFYYGEYNTNYPGFRKVDENVYTFSMPTTGTPQSMVNAPKDADLLFVHDDAQRIAHGTAVNAPRILWLPIDHENPDPPLFIRNIGIYDEVIPISKFAYESRDYWTREWIYNPVETDFYKPGPSTKKKFGFKEDDFVLLYVGNTGWRKRVSQLVILLYKLKQRIKNVKLLLMTNVAPSPTENFNLLEVIRGLGVQEDVFFPRVMSPIQPVPADVIADAYRACDVYVSTHGGEGMGLPMAEALSSGKPVVATDYTTTREFVGDKEERGLAAKIGSYVFDRGIKRPYADLDDMADKIHYLFENPDVRERMGNNGRKWAVENVNADVIADKLKSVFKEYEPIRRFTLK